MKLKVTFLGVALVVTGACGGEEAEIDELIEEIVSIRAQAVEEWERVAEIVRQDPRASSEAIRRARIHDWTTRAEQAAQNAEREEETLRDAAARDAWNELYLLHLAQMTPLEFLQDGKRRAEEGLAAAVERRRAIEEYRAPAR